MNKLILVISILFISLLIIFSKNHSNRDLNRPIPLIAIANYGPNSSLDEAITGLKEELRNAGYNENTNIQYKTMDVNFDASLIPQMLMQLRSQHPSVFIAMTTPVAQYAKNTIHDIPIVFNVITDPVAAGLIIKSHQACQNITGSSDQQNLIVLFRFVTALLPKARTLGFLYAPSEANDMALLAMLKQAANLFHINVLAKPVQQTRDIPILMEQFRGKVDFMYVGASGPIQPAIPQIAAMAKHLKIPVFNVDAKAVKDGLVFASYGVNYRNVGRNAGKLVAQLLKGRAVNQLPPLYPSLDAYQGYINREVAKQLGIHLLNIPKHTSVVG